MRTRLYKNGDHMAIETDAINERAFLEDISTALSALIDSGTHEGDWEFQFGYWLPQIVDICCVYRGYKTETEVSKRTLLIAGVWDITVPLEVEVIDGRAICHVEKFEDKE